MDLAFRICGDDPVHEIEEFDAPASLVVAAQDLVVAAQDLVVSTQDLAAADVEGGEQRGRSMPLIVMRLPGERAPAGQLQVALSRFERLNGRLFVDSKHDRVVRRGQVKPDNLGRLGCKFRIVADAPGFAPGEIDLLGAQKPPDVLDMNVAERLSDQRSGPIGAAFRRRRVEQRQNAAACIDPVFGLGAAIAGLRKASPTILRA